MSGRGILVAALCLALLSPSCRPAAPSGRIDGDSVQVEVGTGGLVQDGRWNRVLVSAMAVEGAFDGVVEISGRTPEDTRAPESFQAEFRAAGEWQTIEVPVLLRGWRELVVTFRGAGAHSVSRKVLLDLGAAPKFRMLVIGPASPGVLVPAVQDWLGLGKGEGAQDDVFFGRVSPGALPTHFLGYDAADLVILNRTALAEADPEQIEALREWVRRGGTVAGVPGPDWSGLLPEPVKELFGLESAPQEGLLIENRFGSGAAFLIAFAAGAGLLDSASGKQADAWKEVVLRSRGRFRTLSGDPMAVVQPEAMRLLTYFSGFRFPSRWAVLVFVLVYLGVSFFAAGAFFRRLKRLEWMYVFAALMAALSSYGIYRYGLISAVKEMSLDEVTLASVRKGSAIADAASFVGVSSPDRRVMKPEFAEEVRARVISSQPPVTETGALIRTGRAELLPMIYSIRAGVVEMQRIELHPNSTRFLRFDYPVELGGELSARMNEGAVQVRNGTRYPLKLSLVRGGAVHELGLLGAGEDGRFAPGPERAIPADAQEHMMARAWMSVSSEEELVRWLEEALHRGISGSTHLIAQAFAPVFPQGTLGPSRKSVAFFLVELAERGER